MNICIWHKGCTDGFGSAWVVNRYFNNPIFKEEIEFHEGVYGEDPPDVTDKNVYIVDFSYSRSTIEKMLETANTITIIDHHKTAIENLSDLKHPNLELVFDIEHSGAVLTWKHFFGEALVPQILLHIEDRDLWKFKLSKTREITTALYSRDFDFKEWDQLVASNISLLLMDGTLLLKHHNRRVASAVKNARMEYILGHNVPVVNCSYDLASDVGNELCVDHPFSVMYSDTKTHRVFSLRSNSSGLDVADIASKFVDEKGNKGGGHKHAAGFKLPLTSCAQVSFSFDKLYETK